LSAAASESGVTTAAVPYATISLIVPDGSELSKRIERMALAPGRVALETDRSSA